MAELIHESSAQMLSRDGNSYRPVVMGEQHADGTWHGRIEFRPAGSGPVLSTGRETSQVSRGALEYWATGLETTYMEGAFERAEVLVGTK